MESIELPIGLTAVGGLEGEGKTSFCLKLANHIAQRERVLFISYQDYMEKIETRLVSIDRSINPGLEIRTDFEYFGLDTYVKLMWLLQDKPYSTVFIDNSDFLNKYDPWDQAYGEVDDFIEALEFMHHVYKVKIVFTVNIGQKANLSRKYPMLRDFNSSRHIANKCHQVLALYRPYCHGYTEDENGMPLKNQLEIFSLKNHSNKTKTHMLDWSSFFKA